MYNTVQEGVLKKYVRTIQRYGDRTCQAMYGARDNNQRLFHHCASCTGAYSPERCYSFALPWYGLCANILQLRYQLADHRDYQMNVRTQYTCSTCNKIE